MKNHGKVILMDISDLVHTYADVCNKALLLNKDRFPFKQILGAAQNAEQGNMIEVSVAGMPNRESFVFHLTEKGIIAKSHAECGNCECNRKWNVSREYLENVSNNPQNYIENPAQIDWEWMYDTPKN